LGAWKLGDVASHWVDQFLSTKGEKILEFGCGNGTIERSKKYKVTAIEHDLLYIKDDFRCIHAPLIFIQDLSCFWYDINYFKELKFEEFDIIIIDGPPGDIGRKGILSEPWIFKLSNCILIDDTHRQEENDLVSKIEAILINVERVDLIENSKWGLRKTTILNRSDNIDKV